MSLFNKILLGIISILLLICGFLYVKIDTLELVNKQKTDSLFIYDQNNKALQDELIMKANLIQDYAIFVQNLQNELDNYKNKYIILKSRYTLLLDSIQVLNDSALVSIIDSIIKVEFSGKENKVSYDGNTKYSIKTNNATYSINIDVEPTEITSEIYADSSNNIKQYLYADGVLIDNAKTYIDSSVFLLLKNNEISNILEKNIWDKVGIFGFLNNFGNISNFDKSSLLYGVGAYYDNLDNFDISFYKPINNKDYFINIRYKNSIRVLVNKIF